MFPDDEGRTHIKVLILGVATSKIITEDVPGELEKLHLVLCVPFLGRPAHAKDIIFFGRVWVLSGI